MKWLALFSVVITVGQLHAYPKSNENDVKAMEEALFAQLLRMEQESSPVGVNNDLQDETALEQTNAHCTNPEECSCQLKTETVTTIENGATCFTFEVPYCEGPCQSVHRYNWKSIC